MITLEYLRANNFQVCAYTILTSSEACRLRSYGWYIDGKGHTVRLSAEEAAGVMDAARAELGPDDVPLVAWAVLHDDPPEVPGTGITVTNTQIGEKDIGYMGVYFATGADAEEDLQDHLSEYRGCEDIGAPHYVEYDEELKWQHVM